MMMLTYTYRGHWKFFLERWSFSIFNVFFRKFSIKKYLRIFTHTLSPSPSLSISLKHPLSIFLSISHTIPPSLSLSFSLFFSLSHSRLTLPSVRRDIKMKIDLTPIKFGFISRPEIRKKISLPYLDCTCS